MKEIHISQIAELSDKESFIQALFHDGILDICIHYESNFQKTQLLRDIVDMIGAIGGLDNQWRRRIVLIVDELNNNAIEYGSHSGDLNKMYFSFITGEKPTVKIQVEDSGTGASHHNAEYMQALQSEKIKLGFDDHSSIRGRGLFMIITKLVDNLYFKDSSDGGLIVGIEKTFF